MIVGVSSSKRHRAVPLPCAHGGIEQTRGMPATYTELADFCEAREAALSEDIGLDDHTWNRRVPGLRRAGVTDLCPLRGRRL